MVKKPSKMQSINSRLLYSHQDMGKEYAEQCLTMHEKQNKERKDFDNLSKQEKAKRICFHIESALEYEDCLERYSEEETDTLAMKIATGCTNYTDSEEYILKLFYSCHEQGINDAIYEIQFIYDVCTPVYFDD